MSASYFMQRLGIFSASKTHIVIQNALMFRTAILTYESYVPEDFFKNPIASDNSSSLPLHKYS
jgi:hypothetical protein